jgi:hypothetical protein
MTRLLVLLATAGLAVSVYAATAGGGQQAVTPAQFRALKAQVAKIRNDLNTTTAVLSGCVMGTALPVSQYTGYVYTPDGGTNFGTTTALDLTEQGGTPNGYALLVNSDPNCVSLVNSTLTRFSAAKTHFAAGKTLRFVPATR